MTERDDEPIDPAVFDEERFHNLIELGLVNHPDREGRVARFLRAGASFELRKPDEDTVEVVLLFTLAAPLMAATRAEVSGVEPEAVQAADRDEVISIITAPGSALRRPPQG